MIYRTSDITVLMIYRTSDMTVLMIYSTSDMTVQMIYRISDITCCYEMLACDTDEHLPSPHKIVLSH